MRLRNPTRSWHAEVLSDARERQLRTSDVPAVNPTHAAPSATSRLSEESSGSFAVSTGKARSPVVALEGSLVRYRASSLEERSYVTRALCQRPSFSVNGKFQQHLARRAVINAGERVVGARRTQGNPCAMSWWLLSFHRGGC